MSYLVLARKWRPRSFETLVGQEHVVRALTHALREGRLHHAYLFTGTRGIGKTTIARILAKSLNCETGVTPTPCGQCSACTEIDGGRFVDLLEVDAATNTKVDEMRQLLENAVYAPTRGRYKVYVIDEVHMLSNAAFNAMLKTLEEPPDHVKFILATTDPQKIPVTVLSRCLQFNLKQMPQAAIVEHLGKVLAAENVVAELGALRHLARAANGSMRDALSLLDQAIAHGAGRVVEDEVQAMLGTVGNDHVFAIVDALLAADAHRLYAIAKAMEERALSLDTALAVLCDLMVRLQVIQLAPGALDPTDPDAEKLQQLAGAMHPEFVQLAYEIALQGREQLPHAPDHGAGFLMTLLRLHSFSRHAASEVGEPEKKKPLSLPSEPNLDSGRADRNRAALSANPSIGTDLGVPREPSLVRRPSSGSGLDTPVPVGSVKDAVIGDWPSLLDRLGLSGMVRALAQNCELASVNGDRIELRLSPAHRHLLTRAAQDKVQQAVESQTGVARTVVITLAETRGETPAAQTDRARKAEREQAIEAVESDQAVREMIEFLDATVIESSISFAADAGPSQSN
jgi:DNA polymerase III subunit gamma/tau